MSHKDCPKCGAKNGVCIGVEYSYGSKYRYDGVSEWRCGNPECNYREGRWCGNELIGNEVEPSFCGGTKGHPSIVQLDD